MAALPKARIPRSKAEVERWAATLQAGALNDYVPMVMAGVLVLEDPALAGTE